MNTRLSYVGAPPEANATVTLYSTNTQMDESAAGSKWIAATIKCSHAGTLRCYWVGQSGVEHLLGEDEVTGGDEDDPSEIFEYYIEPHRKIALRFDNDGTEQETFDVDVCLSCERARAAT